MALSSTSTLDDALAQYKDNLSWEGSVTKAKDALEAIRFIMACRPQIMAHGDRTMNFASFEREKTLLEGYLEANDATSQPRVSFTTGRPLL